MKKYKWNWIVIVAVYLFTVFCVSSAYAAETPTITKISMKTGTYYSGDRIQIDVALDDPASGLFEQFPGNMVLQRDGSTGEDFDHDFLFSTLMKNPDGSYHADFLITDEIMSGDYYIRSVSAVYDSIYEHTAYASVQYEYGDGVVPYEMVTIQTEKTEIMPPVVTKVESSDGQTLDEGDSFEILVYANDEGAGVAQKDAGSVQVDLEGGAGFSKVAPLVAVSDGVYKAVFSVDNSWVTGSYTLSYVLIKDEQNNEAVYSSMDDNSVIPEISYEISTTLTIEELNKQNEEQAARAPKCEEITFSKPEGATLHAGESLTITVELKDGSNELVEETSLVTVSAFSEEGNWFNTMSIPLHKLRDNIYTAELTVTEKWVSGHYIIQGINLADVHHNGGYETPEFEFDVETEVTDSNAPVVSSVLVDGDHYVGESVKVKVLVTDDTGIDEENPGYACIFPAEFAYRGAQNEFYSQLEKEPDGSYAASFVIDSKKWKEGAYFCQACVVDQYGNKTVTYGHTIPCYFNVFATDEYDHSVYQYNEIEMEPIATLRSHTISLAGNIGINYYLYLSEEALNDEGAKVVFELPNDLTSEIPVREGIERTSGDKTYYIYSCNVHSTQMTGTVTAKVVLSDGRESEEFPYTVKDYADIIIANKNNNAAFTKATPLVKAMLNYGGYAQEFFRYDDSALANADLTDEERDVSGVKAEDLEGYAAVKNGTTPSGLSYKSSTLLLTSATAIRHNFTLEEGHEISEYTFRCGNKVLTPVKRSDDVYYVEIPDVASGDLDTMYTVTVGDFSIQYSAMTYVYNQLKKEANPEALKDLMRAMVLYNREANEYFV